MTKAKKNITKYVPDETVISKIYIINGQKVMLDFDLAALYGVTTKALNQAVKRNTDRFPDEFIFRLSKKEWQNMRSQFVTASVQNIDTQKDKRSQFVTASQRQRNADATPFAFTEHGVAMLANVLKSKKAVQMSLLIVRTFIQLRKQIFDYSELTEQIKALKLHLGEHDAQLNQIYNAIENLLDEKAEQVSWKDRKRIGFNQK